MMKTSMAIVWQCLIPVDHRVQLIHEAASQVSSWIWQYRSSSRKRKFLEGARTLSTQRSSTETFSVDCTMKKRPRRKEPDIAKDNIHPSSSDEKNATGKIPSHIIIPIKAKRRKLTMRQMLRPRHVVKIRKTPNTSFHRSNTIDQNGDDNRDTDRCDHASKTSGLTEDSASTAKNARA